MKIRFNLIFGVHGIDIFMTSYPIRINDSNIPRFLLSKVNHDNMMA